MKLKKLQSLFILITLLCQISVFAQWRTIEAPYGIIQSFGAASENKLFLHGGLGGAGYVSTVAVYDITANSWSEMPLSTPRTMIAATINGNSLFCAGGIQFEGGAVEYSAVEIYDVNTNEQIGLAELSVPRIGHSAVSVGTKVIFAGGANPTIDPNTFSLTGFEAYSTVDIYDTATDAWSVAELSDPRAGMAHAVLGTKAYFAGGDKGNGVVSDVVDIYDSATDTWTTEKLSIARTFYGGGGAFNGKVYFAGGTTADSKTTTQIDIFDPTTSTWSAEQLSTPRGGVQIGTTEKHIIFAAGASESNLVEWQSDASSNVVDIYNIETNEWNIYEMDVQRMNHTVLSAQDQVFVIGGVDVSANLTHSSIEVFRGKQLDFDGAVTDNSIPNEYTITTLNHLREGFSVTYQIENTGKFSLNSISLIFEVKKDGELIETETKVVDLPASGDIQEVSYSYLPEEVGIYEITVAVNQPNIGSIFYTDSKTFEVSSNTLAKDDGGVDTGISFGNISLEHYGYFGIEYELLTTDQLSAVSTVVIPLADFSDPTATFHLLIKAIDPSGNLQEEDIYKSELLTASDYFKEDFSFATIELPNPITLNPGRYLFALGQDELGEKISFGLDDSKGQDDFWWHNIFEMADWVTLSRSKTLMIRPHFEEVANTTSAAEQWNKKANSVISIGTVATDIEMLNDQNIWISTSSDPFAPEVESNIYKSMNGGETWEQTTVPDNPNHAVVDLSVINEQTAYVVMIDFLENAQDSVLQDGIFKTTDGGSSWSRIESYPHNPMYVHFFNENEAWVIGVPRDEFILFDDEELSDIIMSTTNDGGQTWSHAGGTNWEVPEGRTLPPLDSLETVGAGGYFYTKPYDVFGDLIMIGGNQRYWVSKDKGVNWEAFESPLFANDTYRTHAIGIKDETTFILASNQESTEGLFRRPKAYATKDGGQTWIASDLSVNVSSIEYLPNTESSFIISGHVQRSTNSGGVGTERTDDLTTWELVDDKPILIMDFASEQGIGAFGNLPNAGDIGNIFNWGEAFTPAYDALILRNSQYTYSEVTLNHLEDPVVLNYAIQSIGLNDLENTIFYLEVLRGGVLVYSDSTIIDLVDTSGTETSFSYLPDELGLYEFKISATQENIGNGFFQDIQILNVNETTLSKDDGLPDNGFSLSFISPQHYGYIGSEYKLLTKDQLRGITLLIIPDTIGSFNLLIKKVSDNGVVQEEDVFKSEPISGSEVPDNFNYTYVFDKPLDLEAGNYIFSAGQDQVNGVYVFGFDIDRVNPDGWIYNPLDTAVWEKEGGITMMIRPHFGNFMTTSTTEQWINEIPLQVFPNPTNDQLFIALDYEQELTTRLQFFDVTGKNVIDKVVNNQQLIQQDISQLSEGMYFLTLTNGNYQRTVKVLKN